MESLLFPYILNSNSYIVRVCVCVFLFTCYVQIHIHTILFHIKQITQIFYLLMKNTFILYLVFT